MGIFGAIAGAGLGLKWQSDLNDPMVAMSRAMIEGMGAFGDAQSGQMAQQISQMETAASMLLLAAAVGGVSSVLLMIKQGPPKALGILLIIAGVFPMIFSPNAIFGLPMTLAGLMALFLKQKDKSTQVIKTGRTATAEYIDPVDFR